jgi:hypothetical protein
VHDVADTEEFDAFQEHYWPDRFKQVIRARLGAAVQAVLAAERAFAAVYEERYGRNFSTYERFLQRIGEAAVIGAENGADDLFAQADAAIDAGGLPAPRLHPRPLLAVLSAPLQREIAQAVVAEYVADHFFAHEHEHCAASIPDYNDFMSRLAELVAGGALNGADDALAAVYRSLYHRLPFPVLRRRPKRLRRW